MMPIKYASRLTFAAFVALGACSDSTPPGPAGPPAQIVVLQGQGQSVPAFTQTAPIQLSVRDAAGTPVGAGQQVTFTIVAGGGFIAGASNTATTDADGNVSAPAWQLGRSNIPQTMRASLGTIQADVNASIATQYNIVVRFFGDPISQGTRDIFENAAARLEGIITGDIVDASANLDLSSSGGCNTPGLPTVNETVDDIVIYAAVTAIDGPGNVLGQATPCVGRRHPDSNGKTMVAYGYMKFDAADFPNIANPQEVILHEMLHILGSGTLWETDRALITGKLGPDPRFLGPLAQQACLALGATVTCATSVPLENTGGTGTRDFHWRETAFASELMTGFYNSGNNPLSNMTIASMADLGFVVNNIPADPYTFVGTMQMSLVGTALPPGWEQVGSLRGMLRPDGKVEAIKR